MTQELVTVLIVLAVIVIGAAYYVPKDYFGSWKLLADAFATQDRPRSLSWRSQYVHVYSFAWTFRGLMAGEYAKFDIGVADEGLWMVYGDPEPRKAPDRMLIPWAYFRLRTEKPSRIVFEIAADRIVQLMVERDLGEAILGRLGAPPATQDPAD